MSIDNSASISQLHHLIDQHYTLGEIRLLCFQMGIDYDHLSGSEKLGKITELVLYCQRHGRLPALLKKLREQRPHIVWPDSVIVPEPLSVARSPTSIEPPLQRPARATYFTGREAELAQLLADLQPGRVVTLTGPGGIGKSALAAEAVWQLAPDDEPPDRFPDGIIFHSFYNQPQVELAFEHVIRSYGQEPRPPLRETAQAILGRRRALLLLDGAEDADNLPALLAIRGRCGVLVTSRQHSDAEEGFQDVAPLPPAAAVALLQKWAGTYADDEPAARQIAELVGGLPLALRLAGRYLASHAQEASEYLAWLKTTPLSALDHGERRQESATVLIERSLQPLSPAARDALALAGLLALAPFEAEVVAATLAVTPNEAGRSLGELVNYGLLLRQSGRYQLSHALVHTYASRRLSPPEATLPRLAGYYADVAEKESAQGLAGYRRLHPLRSHLLAVLGRCVDAAEWEASLSLAVAIDSSLAIQGFANDRVTVLQAGLKAARALQHRYYEAAFLGDLGNVYYVMGQVAAAIDYHQQTLTIASKIGYRQGEATALDSLGSAYHDLGEVKVAIDYHQRALAISREINDRQGEATHLGNLGIAHRSLGQVEAAINYHKRALAIDREIGFRQSQANQLAGLGLAYRDLGQVEVAIKYHKQALAIDREIGFRRGEAIELGNLGLAYRDLGEAERAIEYDQQALTIAREIGYRQGEAVHLGSLGLSYYALGKADVAIDYHQQALVIARKISYRQGEVAHLSNLGLSYYVLGQTEVAIDYYKQALVIAREIGDRQGEANVLGNLGSAYSDMEQAEVAIGYYKQVLSISREIGYRQGQAAALGSLGITYSELGQLAEAIGYYEEALATSREIGFRYGEADNLGNLGLVHSDLGQVKVAVDYYKQALSIAREIGYRQGEAANLDNLGKAYRDLGDVDRARDHLTQALAIYEAIKSPEAEGVRGRLAELPE